MEINIVSKTVTPTFTFDKLYIRNMSVVPFKTATLSLQLHFVDPSGLLSENQRVLYKTIELTTDEYNNWTTDEYIVDLVLSKLNLQPRGA